MPRVTAGRGTARRSRPDPPLLRPCGTSITAPSISLPRCCPPHPHLKATGATLENVSLLSPLLKLPCVISMIPPLIVQILAPLHRFGDASPPTPPPRAAGPPGGHHRSSEFPRRLGTPSSCHSSAPHVDSMHRWTPVSFMLPIVLTPADGVHLVAQSAAASGAGAGVEAW
jgi:hypothetical protein